MMLVQDHDMDRSKATVHCTVLVASKPFRGHHGLVHKPLHNPQPQHIQLLKRCLKIEEEHSSPNARDFHQHLATTCQFNSVSISHRLLRLNGLKTRRCRSFPSHLALIRWLSDRRLLRTGVVLLRLKAPVAGPPFPSDFERIERNSRTGASWCQTCWKKRVGPLRCHLKTRPSAILGAPGAPRIQWENINSIGQH